MQPLPLILEVLTVCLTTQEHTTPRPWCPLLQDPASAPKYLALRKLLDAKQAAANPTGCMNATLGYRALGDRSFYGQPAVLAPARGAVWIQVCLPGSLLWGGVGWARQGQSV